MQNCENHCHVFCHTYFAEHVFGKEHKESYLKNCPNDDHQSTLVCVDGIYDCEDHYKYCNGDCPHFDYCKCQERP